MKEALKELEHLIDLTGTLERQTYMHNKLKLIKQLINKENVQN